jgi:hypothetical protein
MVRRTAIIVTEVAAGWASAEEKMGLAALAAEPASPKNRWVMTELIDEINALMRTSTHDLDAIERTLTDGYAHALSLEAEKWRIEKRISEVAQTLQRGDTAKKTRELSALAKRLDGNADDLTRLRGLLAQLRAHADGVRVSA